jgi:hypothetical protein
VQVQPLFTILDLVCFFVLSLKKPKKSKSKPTISTRGSEHSFISFNRSSECLALKNLVPTALVVTTAHATTIPAHAKVHAIRNRALVASVEVNASATIMSANAKQFANKPYWL